MSCPLLSYPDLSCPVFCPFLSCPALSHHVLSFIILSCLSCPILSCLVQSYLILPCMKSYSGPEGPNLSYLIQSYHLSYLSFHVQSYPFISSSLPFYPIRS